MCNVNIIDTFSPDRQNVRECACVRYLNPLILPLFLYPISINVTDMKGSVDSL